MGRFISMRCPTCDGTGYVNHFDSETGKWIDHMCFHCYGTGEVSEYQDDYLTYDRGEIW